MGHTCKTERLFLLCLKIKLEFGSVGIWREENLKEPVENPWSKARTSNKPTSLKEPGIEPGPQWLEASALGTAPSLLPKTQDPRPKILVC